MSEIMIAVVYINGRKAAEMLVSLKTVLCKQGSGVMNLVKITDFHQHEWRFSPDKHIPSRQLTLLVHVHLQPAVCACACVSLSTVCVRSTAMIFDKAIFHSSSVKALVTSPVVAWRIWSSTTKNLSTNRKSLILTPEPQNKTKQKNIS